MSGIDPANGASHGLCGLSSLNKLLPTPESGTLKKLGMELDSTWSPTDYVAPWSEVRSFTYIRVCVDKSMRSSPSLITDLARRTAPEGTRVDDETVPGKRDVLISADTPHHDSTIFPNSEVFRPRSLPVAWVNS